MKLVHPDLEGQLKLDLTRPNQWIIESPEYFSKYMQELYIQIAGKEGNFVLSDSGEEKDISNYAELIMNPFSMNVNDKKVLNRLYMELSEIAYREDCYLLTQEVLSTLQNYFLQIEQKNSYILESEESIDISVVWKLLGVKFEYPEDNLLEKTGRYIQIMAELLKKRLLIFVNFGSYLNDWQLEKIAELANCNEIAVLFIENTERNFSNAINRYIIDKDGCEIY